MHKNVSQTFIRKADFIVKTSKNNHEPFTQNLTKRVTFNNLSDQSSYYEKLVSILSRIHDSHQI